MTTFDNDLMKRRLTYKGNRVYIKHLTSKYALVSYNNTGSKKFKVDVKDLAKLDA
tara:strand:- start:3752 stop:3916 length:165 start_codon:yes stop_codon:yes gene_type:complete